MNDVEQVKERLDVAEVIGGYIPLKQAGRNLKAPCPFHQEKSASFMVSPEKGIWHCFGCNAGGDIITFVMQYEGLEFRDALALLAGKAGIELKERTPASQQAKQEQKRLHEALNWAVKYYQQSLVQNPSALEYATKRRHLRRQTIQDFQIGYAPDDWNALGQFLLKKKFTPIELLKAGLAGQKTGRSTIYDLYRGRLMFTICDASGAPVGFTGRVLDEEQLPKYLNTPQTELYDKSRIIFGLHLAKDAIRTSNEVVIVEGNMDVVASHQAGVKQVVAVSGTALTLDQLKVLGRLTKNIKICFDADAAGLRATERAIELSQKLGLTLSMVRLPEGKDPDDLIQKDVQAWEKAIAEAEYVVDYLFSQIETAYDLTTATGKRQYSDRIAASLRRLADPVEQGHYIKRLTQKLDISEESVRQKINATDGQTSDLISEQRPSATIIKPSTKTARRLLEESVLAINLAYTEVRSSLDDLTPAHFADADHQAILEMLQHVATASAADVAGGLPNVTDYVKILALRGEEEFGSFAPAERSFEAFQLAGRLRIVTNKDTKTKLSRKLREAEDKGDADLAKRLLAQYQTLITEDD
ncbi:MAG TPA: DNA primase [Candidatus Saccharimonadia bacterium]